MNKIKKVLVVDDNSATLTVINGILREFYKVYPVNSGKTALAFLEKQCPDLMLLDIEMPGMSGIELFKIIKANEELSDVPVIFLTSHNDTEAEADAFRLGVSDFIRKPVNDVILQARVRMHLELAALRASGSKES